LAIGPQKRLCDVNSSKYMPTVGGPQKRLCDVMNSSKYMLTVGGPQTRLCDVMDSLLGQAGPILPAAACGRSLK
jgi:hypothetical protein